MRRISLVVLIALLLLPALASAQVTCFRFSDFLVRCEPDRRWEPRRHFLEDFLDAYDRERRLQMDLERHRQERELLRLQIERFQRQEEWEQEMRHPRNVSPPPPTRPWENPEFRDKVEEFKRRFSR